MHIASSPEGKSICDRRDEGYSRYILLKLFWVLCVQVLTIISSVPLFYGTTRSNPETYEHELWKDI